MSLFNEKDECFLIQTLKSHIPNVEDLLNSAVEEAEIDLLESRMNCKFPKDFRSLYMNFNGEGEQIFGVMAGLAWMNIESIVSNWKSLLESAYDIISSKPDVIKDGNYREGWIPFAEDGGGSFWAIDLDPGEKGIHGQIITIDRNSDFSYVIAESLGHFFKFIDSSLRNSSIAIREEDDDVIVLSRKSGSLLDDILALTKMDIEENSLIPVSGFWGEYFKDDVESGFVSSKTLAKERMVFIRADQAKKYGVISLDILTHMVNLKELIIHADEITNFDVLKRLPSLAELVIGSEAFKESDLEYLVSLDGLRQLTLIGLSLKDIHKLKDIKKLKSLRLCRMNSMDSESIGTINNLKELSLEEMEVGDLLYISNLSKLIKLELKQVTIPHLSFLKGLKNITFFETDSCAKDESHIEVISELKKLKQFTYPVGDLTIFKDCMSLKQVGVDASRLKGLEEISDCNIVDLTIFNAASEENAKSVVTEFEKYFKLQSYGWRVTWENC
ncbi:SMI1/KNR4 family protein [Paenibacillus wynnii]|uniref:Cell wall assembly protein n=1 Tax=Paenibacillus wynnii TaxID=268407 RepID=A0A098MEW8_9BACL|nr:SMI1/KNR4 family protein [Paenibacillus wynnii]KGE20087.1 cell wall assembly protein [Paenibacillus wynnii]